MNPALNDGIRYALPFSIMPKIVKIIPRLKVETPLPAVPLFKFDIVVVGSDLV